jgi:hypothetical protein
MGHRPAWETVISIVLILVALWFCRFGFRCLVWVCLLPFRSQRNSNSDWWTWYNGYLQSAEWKWKRKGVLLRSGNLCEKCGASGRINIHHLPGSYKRIPHEQPWDLAALCYDCHKGEHPGKRF